MTQLAKQIAIYDALGYFKIAPLKRTTRKGDDDPNGVVLWYCSEDHGGAKTYDKLPNIFIDLNACAKAEAKLSDEQYSLYGWTLLGNGKIECRDFLSASASQRAETLYKILCN